MYTKEQAEKYPSTAFILHYFRDYVSAENLLDVKPNISTKWYNSHTIAEMCDRVLEYTDETAPHYLDIINLKNLYLNSLKHRLILNDLMTYITYDNSDLTASFVESLSELNSVLNAINTSDKFRKFYYNVTPLRVTLSSHIYAIHECYNDNDLVYKTYVSDISQTETELVDKLDYAIDDFFKCDETSTYIFNDYIDMNLVIIEQDLRNMVKCLREQLTELDALSDEFIKHINEFVFDLNSDKPKYNNDYHLAYFDEYLSLDNHGFSVIFNDYVVRAFNEIKPILIDLKQIKNG